MADSAFSLVPTLVVGVTGHRMLEAPEAVRVRLDTAFGRLRSALASVGGEGETRLRVLSPLAEGADRIVAEAGLDAGAALQCPLPFARAEYEADFTTPASRDAFHRLLGQAERVLELDGDPLRREDAYLDVGHLVVSHCDLLIALWDEQHSRGKGGTAEVVGRALQDGVLTLVIDPTDAKPPRWFDSAGHAGSEDLAALQDRLAGMLGGPVASPDPRQGVTFQTFAAERRPRFSFGYVFDLFTDAVRLKFQPPKPRSRNWLQAAHDDWTGPVALHPGVADVCAPCMDGETAAAFTRADTLARQYAGFYRSTFVANFLLSALAVAVAVFGAPEPGVVSTVVELAAILFIISLTWLANRRNWHERWIEYRHLAEQLRPMRFLFPLALNLPKPHMARPVIGKDQQSVWIDWLTRRIERALGLPNARITPDYLAAVQRFVVDDILNEQVRYHRRNSGHFHTVDHRLHILGMALFQITAATCLLDLLLLLMLKTGRFATTFEVAQLGLFRISGTIPAFGAAILGIRNVGEFARLERRSSAMAAALEATRTSLERDDTRLGHRRRLGGHVQAIAAQMMSETADWRTLVITRRIEWPG